MLDAQWSVGRRHAPNRHFLFVVPAKAGSQGQRFDACPWIPAFAGATNLPDVEPPLKRLVQGFVVDLDRVAAAQRGGELGGEVEADALGELVG